MFAPYPLVYMTPGHPHAWHEEHDGQGDVQGFIKVPPSRAEVSQQGTLPLLMVSPLLPWPTNLRTWPTLLQTPTSRLLLWVLAFQKTFMNKSLMSWVLNTKNNSGYTGMQTFFWICSFVYNRLLSTTTLFIHFAFKKLFSNIWWDKLKMLLIRQDDRPHLT